MILFRPVGLEELRLIYDAGLRAFPPRLPEQPIFYPVLNEQYARQIAVEWDTTSGSRAGFVTRFDVRDAYVAQFERRIVGSRVHEELWVPAEELPRFNAQIRGTIAVTRAHFGAGYRGFVPSETPLAGVAADEQLLPLAGFADGALEELLASEEGRRAVFLNWFVWEQTRPESVGLSGAALSGIFARLRAGWQRRAPGLALGCVT
jgi:hypothetical protein